MTSNNQLTRNEIIQIDATAIVGALIFLTIRFGRDSGTVLPSSFYNFLMVIFASIIIVPFTASALYALRGSILRGQQVMILGFIFVIVSIVYLLVVSGIEYCVDPKGACPFIASHSNANVSSTTANPSVDSVVQIHWQNRS